MFDIEKQHLSNLGKEVLFLPKSNLSIEEGYQAIKNGDTNYAVCDSGLSSYHLDQLTYFFQIEEVYKKVFNAYKRDHLYSTYLEFTDEIDFFGLVQSTGLIKKYGVQESVIAVKKCINSISKNLSELKNYSQHEPLEMTLTYSTASSPTNKKFHYDLPKSYESPEPMIRGIITIAGLFGTQIAPDNTYDIKSGLKIHKEVLKIKKQMDQIEDRILFTELDFHFNSLIKSRKELFIDIDSLITSDVFGVEPGQLVLIDTRLNPLLHAQGDTRECSRVVLTLD